MSANCLLFACFALIIWVKEAIIMAKTANVFARVEPELKEQAEHVLDQLGISMSDAVGMFLRQIVLHNGIPFEMKLPASGAPSKSQLYADLMRRIEAYEKMEREYPADRAEEEWKKFHNR